MDRENRMHIGMGGQKDAHIPVGGLSGCPGRLEMTRKAGRVLGSLSKSGTSVFFFWPPPGIWSSRARDQTGAAVAT